ncbi:DUF6266 family protein [Algoriphagus terrigena]|uniref:DUF6266 family protein n=1 Tax=Algoriphagus terrigena TaxID=344884 RepID=UPI00040317F7|nr:DUF6266 family protein [Algoriphagus terrigena]
MAQLNHPFIGRISGKLGNLVIYQLNGKTVVREKPQWKKSYQATALQRLYQQKFKLATAALRPLLKVLDTGYGEYVTSTRKGFHLALSQTLKFAMLETQGTVSVNYESMLISSGFVSPVLNLQTAWVGTRELSLHWESQGNQGNARDSDLSWIVLYNPDQGIVEEFTGGAFRRTQSQILTLSPRLNLEGTYLYLSFYRQLTGNKRRFSDSVCIALET